MKGKILAVGCCLAVSLYTFALPPVPRPREANLSELAKRIQEVTLPTAREKFMGPNAFSAAEVKYLSQGPAHLAEQIVKDLKAMPQFPQIAEGVSAFMDAWHTADATGHNVRNLLAEMGTLSFTYPAEAASYLQDAARQFDGTYMKIFIESYMGRSALSDETGSALLKLQKYSMENELKGPYWEQIEILARYRGVDIRVIHEANPQKDYHHDENGLPIGGYDYHLNAQSVMHQRLEGKGVLPLSVINFDPRITEWWIALQRGTVYGFVPDAQVSSFLGDTQLPRLLNSPITKYALPEGKFISTCLQERFQSTQGKELYRYYILWQEQAHSLLNEVKHALEKNRLDYKMGMDFLNRAQKLHLELAGYKNMYLVEEKVPAELADFDNALQSLMRDVGFKVSAMKE